MFATSRLPDWETRFARFLAAHAMRAHEYGQHDCLLWCAADIEAVTGVDYGATHRGQYSTKAEAQRYLIGLGFRDPAELLDSLFVQKPVLRAGRADLVLDSDGIPGVCIGPVALMVGEGGTLRVPRADWRRAWVV